MPAHARVDALQDHATLPTRSLRLESRSAVSEQEAEPPTLLDSIAEYAGCLRERCPLADESALLHLAGTALRLQPGGGFIAPESTYTAHHLFPR